MQTEPLAELAVETAEETGDSQTPGEILAQERLRLGLNEKEVADQLHITMHYVKALESNSYEKLPGSVFAKGYLKSYALLLGLDVADLLSRYDVINNRTQADIQEASRLVKARKKKDRNKPLVIVSLLVFVGGFLGLWLANSYFGADELPQTPATAGANSGAQSIRPALTPQQTRQPQLTLQAEAEAIVSPVVEPSTSPALASQLPEASPESIVSAESSVMDLDSEQSGGESDLQLQNLADVLQAIAAEQAAVVPEAAASVTAIEPEQQRVITIEAMGNDVLRMSFSGESWVEVNDSDSQQIYRDIREAGDVLEITGSAPFNILLGDAPFTRLSLNGAEIDLSSDIRIDNSARLTVGL